MLLDMVSQFFFNWPGLHSAPHKEAKKTQLMLE